MTMLKDRKIIILTGPPAAGKSTVSKLLAEHFAMSAVVSVDTLRHFLKKGKVNLRTDDNTDEGQKQLELSTRNAISIANNMYDAGFTVIIDDVISSKKRLDMCFDDLHVSPDVFVLMPDRNVIAQRDVQRSAEEQMGDKAHVLHDVFLERIEEEKRWILIDSSQLTPEQTVDEIVNGFSRGK